MAINDKDYFHGAALMAVVNHPSFTALNRASKNFGHYVINKDRLLFVKYCSDGEDEWRFSFNPPEVRRIAKGQRESAHAFVALVCGSAGVCAFSADELFELLDKRPKGPQGIVVEAPKGHQFQVWGPGSRSLQGKIPRKAFPGSTCQPTLPRRALQGPQ